MSESYDFPNKEIYRMRRETAINRLCNKPPALRTVAYLDAIEALDTLFYLEKGYRPENLYPINNNPAIAAHISRKVKAAGYGPVNAIGMDFTEALDTRIPRVDILNFDGKGILDLDLALEVLVWVLANPSIIISITIQAARDGNLREATENEEWTPENRDYQTSFQTIVRKSHYVRLGLLLKVLTGTNLRSHFQRQGVQGSHCFTHIKRVFWDVYVSRKTPMLWTVTKHEPHHSLSLKEFRKLAKFMADGGSLEALYRYVCMEELEEELARKYGQT